MWNIQDLNVDDFCDLENMVRSTLDPKRFEHTLGVVDCAVSMAKIYIPDDVHLIRIAALLHDLTKNFSYDEHIRILADSGYEITDDDKNAPSVLHGKSSVALIATKWPDLADEKVLSAVYKHTVGDEKMSVFDKIIFFADYIEPGRTYRECVELREEFFDGLNNRNSYAEKIIWLDRCILKAVETTISHLESKYAYIHRNTYIMRDTLATAIQKSKN